MKPCEWKKAGERSIYFVFSSEGYSYAAAKGYLKPKHEDLNTGKILLNKKLEVYD